MGLGGLKPNDGEAVQITLGGAGTSDLVFPAGTVRVSISVEGAENLRYMVDSNAAAPASYGGFLAAEQTVTLDFTSPQPLIFGTPPPLFLHVLNASGANPTRILIFWQTLVLP
jgi:hypothetical protein